MKGDCVLGKIRTENSKDLAFLETAFPETGSTREIRSASSEYLIVRPLGSVDQRRLIAALRRALEHESRYRDFGYGDLREGSAENHEALTLSGDTAFRKGRHIRRECPNLKFSAPLRSVSVSRG